MKYNLPGPFTTKEDGIHAIIETPAHSRNKYVFDKKTNLFTLKKTLPAGSSFPMDFGFIPGTHGEDEDPLDILVMGDEPTFPGCLIKCRLIGVIEATVKKKGKKEIRNDRYVGVPFVSTEHAELQEISDLSKAWVEEITVFFENYNKAKGKIFKVLDIKGPGKAWEAIRNAMI